MRKIASLCTVLMLISALAFGQATRTVSGQVKDDKGEAVPFATIVETGQQKNGTKADASGLFSLKIKEGSQITISATGFNSITVTPGTGVQNITLTTKAGELSEVVVTTALGVKKRPKEIGYANTTLLDRPFVEMFLYLPLAMLGGFGLAGLQQTLQNKIDIRFNKSIGVLFILLVSINAFFKYNLYPSDCCAIVSQDDLTAIQWIDKNLPQNAHILISSTDLNVLPTTAYQGSAG